MSAPFHPPMVAEIVRLRAELEKLRVQGVTELVNENEALREAGERLYRHVRTEYEDEKAARSRWRELAGEPDPIIPGYGRSI